MPGPVREPAIRRAQIPFECRVDVDPSGEVGFSELLIFEGKAWPEFLAAVGKKAANYATPLKDTITELYPALRKLGLKGKATIRSINGRDYVIISGYPGLRKFLNAPRYLATNVKVADLVIGTARLGGSAVRGTALSIVLVGAADVLEAVLMDEDLLSKELGFTIAAGMSKATIGGIAGFLAGAALATVGVPVVLPIAAGIVVGIVVGEVLDEYFPTDVIAKAMIRYYDSLTESFMERGIRFLSEIEREILWRVWPHRQVPFPY